MRTILIFLVLLPGCATFPALDDTISDAAREAPYPTLQPLPAPEPPGAVADMSLNQRIAALQARAERLRQTDIAALQ